MREWLEFDKEGMKGVFQINTFKELILTEFEGRMLPIPKNYDVFFNPDVWGLYDTTIKEMQEWYSHSIKAFRKVEK